MFSKDFIHYNPMKQAIQICCLFKDTLSPQIEYQFTMSHTSYEWINMVPSPTQNKEILLTLYPPLAY